MKDAHREITQDIVIAIVALAGFFYTFTFKRPGSYALQSSVSAAAWPRILLAGIGILACVLALQEFAKAKRAATTGLRPQTQESSASGDQACVHASMGEPGAHAEQQEPAQTQPHAQAQGALRRQAYSRLWWVIVTLAAHAALTPVLGFLLATLLAQAGLLYLLGVRAKTTLLGVPLTVMIAVYLIFVRLLDMSLPRGIGPFLQLSRFFY